MSSGGATFVIQGVDLRDLCSEDGDYTTLLLGPCRSCEGRARMALDSTAIPAPHSGLVLAAVVDNCETSQVIIATPSNAVHRFEVDEPLHDDVARRGSAPSLGVLVEAAQITAPHVVVVADDDVYAITGFGLLHNKAPIDGPIVKEALQHAIDLVVEMQPWLVALVGPTHELEDVREMFAAALPSARLELFAESSGTNLDEIADEIVRQASSMAANWTGDELEHWRIAAAKSYALQGAEAMTAVTTGAARRVYIHDDRHDDRIIDGTRLIDLAVATTISAGLPLVMLPDVDPSRGPSDPVGAIVPPPGQ